MVHSGWAFVKDGDQISKYITQRYSEIKHLRTKEHMDYSKTPAYAQGNFRGTLLSDEAQALSEEDILILMDDGNLCFGGHCSKGSTSFSGAYYTD